jgi:hypothetical protein
VPFAPKQLLLGSGMHKRAPLLLHDGLAAGMELPVPQELHTPRFARFCADRYKHFAPLQQSLVECLT